MKPLSVTSSGSSLYQGVKNRYSTTHFNSAGNSKTTTAASNTNTLNRKLIIASSTIAVASLGAAAYAMIRKPNSVKRLEKQLEIVSQELSNTQKSRNELQSKISELTETINNNKNDIERHIGELKNEFSGSTNDLRGQIEGVRNAVKAPQVVGNMLTRNVEINGQHFNLATVMHGYGKEEGILTETLRSESTRRTLGAIKPVALSDEVMIRVPTIEFQGFAKTGGLATVPRELVANIGAIVNNKQKMELIVDTPMYLGQVENSNFFSLVKRADGKYDYISKKDGKSNLMTRLTKIDENFIPIYTDAGKTTERVEIFLSDEMRHPVPYEETLVQLESELAKQVTEAMQAGKDFETQLVSFIAPKPARVYMKIDNKNVYLDYDSIMNSLDDKITQDIQKAVEMGKNYNITLGKQILEQNGENKIKPFDEKDADAVNKILGNGIQTIKMTFVPPTEAQAEVKFKTLLYKNDKFRMDGPVQNGVVKNIYNNQTTQAGETERSIYLCKFIYENLINNHESSNKALKADWIIGNDWHTGALAAMVRLLTPARKAMGMEPEIADRIANIPITTLMHNFKLQGSIWHSQSKILNIMFGEHAAKIAENAWMPQKADMPGKLMNGLFSDKAINPQTMAMAYADDIIFVSRGNFNEMTTKGEFGGTNYALASLRGRTWQYKDHQKLEQIAMASGIKPDEISKYPTAKGITNGCDRINNILTKQKARKLEEDLNLPVGSLISAEKAILDPLAAHQHNKGIYLTRVIEDINTAKATGGKNNPLKIRDFEHTDLTGADENTLVFGMAGRIVDQKGIDNWAEGTLRFAKRGNYDKNNPPVNYLQGIGDETYINRFMQVKNEIRKIDPKLSDRMVFAGVFSEAGRYDGCKIMSDFCAMPSWDEPCGLVHKEIGYNSGAISIVNKRGGLTDGLREYKRGADNTNANSIFIDFMDKETHSYEEAINHNGEKIADGMEMAQEWFKDKKAFAKGIKASYTARHDWLRGKIQEYIEIGKRHGVIKDNIDSAYKL